MNPVSEKPRRQPVWIPIVQVLQVLLSVAILGLSAWLIHGKYFDSIGFAIFCCLLTWVVAVCLFLTAYIPFLKIFNHPLVLIVANLLMVIFWLAAMGAAAHLRSTFKYSVSVYGCYDDGSSVDSSTCVVGKREAALARRAAVATKTGLSVMSAIAGLSALEMLLFVATLVHAIMTWYRRRSTAREVATAPPKQDEAYPMSAPQQPHQQYNAPVQQPQAYVPTPHAQAQPAAAQQYNPQQSYSSPPQSHQAYSPPPQKPQMPGPPLGYQAELPRATPH